MMDEKVIDEVARQVRSIVIEAFPRANEVIIEVKVGKTCLAVEAIDYHFSVTRWV